MAYNFMGGDRHQLFLLPPDLRDWLPQDHLAWFVLDDVDQVDLAPLYRAHRADGPGHPAYGPKLLLGVLLYAYAIGVRSSRQIQPIPPVGEHEDSKRDQSEPDRPYAALACRGLWSWTALFTRASRS